jgi:hypothetical protein
MTKHIPIACRTKGLIERDSNDSVVRRQVHQEFLSQQNENVRFVQNRNVRFHPGWEERLGPERIELSVKERERLKVLQQVEEGRIRTHPSLP